MSRTRDLGKIISGNFDVPATALDNAATAVNTNVSTLAVTRSNISDLGTGALSHRNLIINGAMNVAQRGTSFTGVTSTSAYHIDRFETGSGDSSSQFTVSQATAGLNGFANSLKFDCTTTQSSLGADSRVFFQQKFEGQDLQQLKKGTSDAGKITISFYVKSTKTGTYIVELYDNDNSRQISQAYTVSSSGTWERKILTFDGDTTGAFNNDNGLSLTLYWHLVAGSRYSSGTLSTSWTSSTDANRAVGQVNLADSTNNTWEITGVQLEVGDTATPFEHRSYGDELAACQRYFFMRKADGGPIGSGIWYANNQILAYFAYPQDMRSAPTITTSSGGFASCYTIGNAIRSLGHVGLDNIKNYAARINLITSSNGVAGHGAYLQIWGSESISVDAEL